MSFWPKPIILCFSSFGSNWPEPGQGGTFVKVGAQVGTQVLGFSWQKPTFMKYPISAEWPMIVKKKLRYGSSIAKTYRVSIGNPSVTVANEASSRSFPPIMPTSVVYDAIIKYSTGINWLFSVVGNKRILSNWSLQKVKLPKNRSGLNVNAVCFRYFNQSFRAAACRSNQLITSFQRFDF